MKFNFKKLTSMSENSFDGAPSKLCEGPKGCDLRDRENGNISDEDCKKCIADHNNYEYK